MSRTTALGIMELVRQFADADMRDVLLSEVVDNAPTLEEIELAMEVLK